MLAFQIHYFAMLWMLITSIESTAIFSAYKQDANHRQTKSHEMRKYINFTVNPCENFYLYACGNWNKLHEYKNLTYDSSITTTALLKIKIDMFLVNLLQANVTLQDGSSGKEMKLFYKSCLEAQVNDYKHQTFINEFIKLNGGFPAIPGSNWLAHNYNYDWQGIIAQLRYNYGLDILIGLEIDVNYQSVQENSIYLTQPSTLLSETLCHNYKTYAPDSLHRMKIMLHIEIEENLKYWLGLTKTEATAVAADILHFEMQICAAMRLDSNDFSSNAYSALRKTLNEFSNQYDKQLDFNRIVTESYGVPIYKPVYMRSPNYFKQLVDIMKKYNSTTVANYIMYLALNYINFSYDDGPDKRTQHCLHMIKRYFPKVLGQLYHRAHAKLSLKTEIEDIFEKIKSTFAQSLENKWLDDGITRLMKKKLSELYLYFPSYEKATFVTYDISLDDFWENQKVVMSQLKANSLKRIYEIGLPNPSKEVEAYDTAIIYQLHHKRIDVGWGRLKDPFYHQQLPKAVLFATTGQFLAEVLILTFQDYIFSTTSATANDRDARAINESFRRVSCFQQQAENYLRNGSSLNNTLQLQNLIAKSAAIKIAFNTYIDWLKYRNSNNDHDTLRKETLPELNFTNTQLFFIAYAQIHCTSPSTATNAPVNNQAGKKLINAMADWLPQYSIADYLVNGPLTNFQEFARDFNCQIGSLMNTADKCNVY